MAPPETDTQMQQICIKCGHVNAAGATLCVRCAARLRLVCRKCGEVNERAASRCAACGARLHRSFFKRLKDRLRKRFKPAELAVLAVGVVLLVAVVGWLAREKSNPAPASGGDVDVDNSVNFK
jgi:ribosomal protein L40E